MNSATSRLFSLAFTSDQAVEIRSRRVRCTCLYHWRNQVILGPTIAAYLARPFGICQLAKAATWRIQIKHSLGPLTGSLRNIAALAAIGRQFRWPSRSSLTIPVHKKESSTLPSAIEIPHGFPAGVGSRIRWITRTPRNPASPGPLSKMHVCLAICGGECC